MAVSNVELRVKATQAVTALKNVGSQAKKLDTAIRDLKGKFGSINDSSKKLGRSFSVLEKRNKGLSTRFNSLGKAIAAVGLVEFGRRSIQTAANFEKLNVRLKLLTEQNGTFARSTEIAAEAQKLFGISSVEALEGITNITARLAPLGVGVEDIRTTFVGFNTAAKLAGASSIEASNAFRQLAQALGSGRLQGDEFRSIAEQVPTILAPIADELGVTIGELKEFAAQGKLTSDVVIRALKRVEEDGVASLKALLENDPTQVFKNLQNEIENLQITIGKGLLPATKLTTVVLTDLTAIINAIPPEITSFVVVTGTLITAFTVLKPLIIGVIGTLKTLKAIIVGITATVGGPLLALIAGVTAGLYGLTKSIINQNKEQKELNDLLEDGSSKLLEERIKVEENTLAQLKNSDARGNAKRGIQRQIKEQEKLIETLKKEQEVRENLESRGFDVGGGTYEVGGIKYDAATGRPINPPKTGFEDKDPLKKGDKPDEGADIVKTLQRQIQLKKTEDKFDRDLLKRKFQLIDSLRNINKIEDEKTRIKAINLETALFEIDKANLLNDKLKDTVGTSENLKEKFKEIGSELKDGVVQGLTDAVMGTKSLAEAATNTLNNLKRKLVEVAIQKAVAGIGGFIGGKFGGFLGGLFGKERGGPVSAGGAYVVGERGPEILQMGSKGGNIIPNRGIGGTVNNVTVNVDAGGMSGGGGNDIGDLGEMIAGVVQQKLIEEQRAGGLLNR